MIQNWNSVQLMPQFSDGGVDCYRLSGDFLNEYYVVSEGSTRRLMNSPEVVGFDVYRAMLPATERMLGYFKAQDRITRANILAILRGALNYPLEEAAFGQGIPVHDISFLSSERTFDEAGQVNGLEIKYNKLATIPGSTLMIGDIIASGDTLINCFRYVIEQYRAAGASLRNIILFTIGGTYGIYHLERLTRELREYWPEFEGFLTVYYEGVFTCYEPGDFGAAGINRALIDFIWRGGIIAPAFRRKTLATRDPLFEKCIIYDGGARRYEIMEHIEEVLEFWNGILERADIIDKQTLLEEKLGYALPIGYDDWVAVCHYGALPEAETRAMYEQEMAYVESLRDVTLEQIAQQRIEEFTAAMRCYKN